MTKKERKDGAIDAAAEIMKELIKTAKQDEVKIRVLDGQVRVHAYTEEFDYEILEQIPELTTLAWGVINDSDEGSICIYINF